MRHAALFACIAAFVAVAHGSTSCSTGQLLTKDGQCVAAADCPEGTWADTSKGKCSKCYQADAKTCSDGGYQSTTSCKTRCLLQGLCMPENRLHKGLYCDANREVKSCGEGVNNCDINGRRLSCFPGYYANLRDGTCTKACPGSKPITDPFPMCDPCPTQGGYPAWLADSQTCVTPPTCGPAYDMFDSAGNYVRTEPATWLDRSTNVCRTCNTGSGNAYSCTDFGSPIYCYDSYRYKAYCVNTCTSGMPASDSDISGADIPAEFLQRHTIGKNCFFGY